MPQTAITAPATAAVTGGLSARQAAARLDVDAELSARTAGIAESWAREGLRVLAVASAEHPEGKVRIGSEAAGESLTVTALSVLGFAAIVAGRRLHPGPPPAPVSTEEPKLLADIGRGRQ